ncbi:hypothetical protein Q6A90_04840 [Aliarcobacter skirrowii]|jgi:hypothetical protein|uniref:hypothetical protein n=1 Tax=Aliarcobacter skirrowii TaxID=28200 RepID=UPI000EC51FE5|nr:hypothetical protein [Aliarcobacter skirrowii]MDX4061688.1 hypothetical protein [Aliarcobacter skirrowii]HAC70153.1 hypothetical protein [Aliarcobacter skirrowii]
MSKKKEKIISLKDCSKCNESRLINNQLHCSLSMQDGKTPSSYSNVSFKDCIWFRPKFVGA